MCALQIISRCRVRFRDAQIYLALLQIVDDTRAGNCQYSRD